MKPTTTNTADKVRDAMMKALRKALPKVPEKPRRFDPWLRLHL